MFSTKFLLSFTTAATLLASAAGQSWEVMVYESSSGGTSSCTGGGTTVSGSDTQSCHQIGLGSNAVGFKSIMDNGPPARNTSIIYFPTITARTSSIRSWDRMPASPAPLTQSQKSASDGNYQLHELPRFKFQNLSELGGYSNNAVSRRSGGIQTELNRSDRQESVAPPLFSERREIYCGADLWF
ncbi:hypothetical protein B0H13DRAFT_1895974 [Mycena leptocephala]|nr:hypothetical protein B0H13DRAFT_1895974 [Mycena leptocephala]